MTPLPFLQAVSSRARLSSWRNARMRKAYVKGDWVIYVKTKYGPQPDPRATVVAPMAKGENYTSQIEKFRRVVRVGDDGTVLLRTQSGKLRLMDADDPNLRHAHWWERVLYRRRFPRPEWDAGGGEDDAARAERERRSAG